MKNIIITFLFSICFFAAIGQSDCPIDPETQIKDFCEFVESCLKDTIVLNSSSTVQGDLVITCDDHFLSTGELIQVCDTINTRILTWIDCVGDTTIKYTANGYDTTQIITYPEYDTINGIAFTTWYTQDAGLSRCVTSESKCDLCELALLGLFDPCNPALASRDCDGGGINNGLECQYGFDPNNSSDDDCVQFMISGVDICAYIAANPNSAIATLDCDNSGVDNVTECNAGNDPLDPSDDCPWIIANNIDVCGNPQYLNTDCDGGGVPALYECAANNEPNTDPTDDCQSAIVTGVNICLLINNDPNHPLSSQDCDGGGVDNFTECTSINPTDPASPDDDCQSLTITEICDLCNTTNGTDPANPVCLTDCDGGGKTNQEECDNGTDPFEPNDDDPCATLAALATGAEICAVATANPSLFANCDTDGGGVSDVDECNAGTDPLDKCDDGILTYTTAPNGAPIGTVVQNSNPNVYGAVGSNIYDAVILTLSNGSTIPMTTSTCFSIVPVGNSAFPQDNVIITHPSNQVTHSNNCQNSLSADLTMTLDPNCETCFVLKDLDLPPANEQVIGITTPTSFVVTQGSANIIDNGDGTSDIIRTDSNTNVKVCYQGVSNVSWTQTRGRSNNAFSIGDFEQCCP